MVKWVGSWWGVEQEFKCSLTHSHSVVGSEADLGASKLDPSYYS